ncbi:MAG: metalloprotease PmbA [Arenicella sp.]
MSVMKQETIENEQAVLVDVSTLERAADKAISIAKKLGADQAEVRLSNSLGQSINVRKQALESVEVHNDRSLSVSVFNQHCTGSASTADLTDKGVEAAVQAAISIAKQTEADPCFGLADKELLASNNVDSAVLEQQHSWGAPINELVEIAQRCEQAGFDVDSRINNSEGAEVNTYEGISLYANSHGFMASSTGSSHSMSCSLIAQENNDMQRDYWYSSSCHPSRLDAPELIGKNAGERTVRRLGGRQIDSCQVPVMFEASLASSLISHLTSAISGGVLYKKASFMLDRLGEQIFPEWLTISENPHLIGEYRSSFFDGEGVATPPQRKIISDGQLSSYILGSFTSRKLGMKTTANSGGLRNVRVSQTGETFDDLVKKMHTGFVVTELIGSGINMVTGDYSRGASGFWVENGEVKHPVHEVTVAGNLLDMFNDIVAIGSDVDTRGNIQTGSILLEKLTIAGA